MNHLVRYMLFRAAIAIATALPRGWVPALCEWLGAMAGALGAGRPVVETNLAIALPNAPTAEREVVRRAFMRHLGRCIGELAVLPSFDNASLAACVTVNGLEAVQQALDAGRGALLIGSHYGNWEYQISALGTHLAPRMYGYAGQQRNPQIGAYLNRLRNAFGFAPIPESHRATQDMVRALRAGHALAITADADYAADRHFSPFFGKPAATATGPATLALKSGCPVFYSWCRRTGPFRFVIELRPLAFIPTGRLQEDIAAFTRLHTTLLEAAILADPAQYLWSYKRWRTRPEDDPAPVYPGTATRTTG